MQSTINQLKHGKGHAVRVIMVLGVVSIDHCGYSTSFHALTNNVCKHYKNFFQYCLHLAFFFFFFDICISCFLMKIFKNHNIALSIICTIIKLVFILIIYITISIASIIIVLYLLYILIFINYYFWLIIICFNVEIVLYFILSILVVSLNHPI